MTQHHVEIHSPHTARQLYDLVMDIETYPEFIPWCRAARILERYDEHTVLAELMIAFKHIRESYVSRVNGNPDALTINVTMERGPFHHLINDWKFIPEQNGCTIHFDIDFQFKSRLLEKIIGSLFNRATQKMVSAFMTRADAIYGTDQSNNPTSTS